MVVLVLWVTCECGPTNLKFSPCNNSVTLKAVWRPKTIHFLAARRFPPWATLRCCCVAASGRPAGQRQGCSERTMVVEDGWRISYSSLVDSGWRKLKGHVTLFWLICCCDQRVPWGTFVSAAVKSRWFTSASAIFLLITLSLSLISIGKQGPCYDLNRDAVTQPFHV